MSELCGAEEVGGVAKLYVVSTKGGGLVVCSSLAEATEKYLKDGEKIYVIEAEVAIPREALVKVEELTRELEGKLPPEELQRLKERLLELVAEKK